MELKASLGDSTEDSDEMLDVITPEATEADDIVNVDQAIMTITSQYNIHQGLEGSRSTN